MNDYYAMPYINANGFHSKSIAYSIYHIFRIEDIVLQSLICNEEQIFFQNYYQNRINSSIITTGNELVKEHIYNFSKDLNIDELYKYILEVNTKTDNYLISLPYCKMKELFEQSKMDHLKSLNVVDSKEE